MTLRIEVTCRARDCDNVYRAEVRQGRQPPQYCSTSCNRREAKHRKRDADSAPQPTTKPVPKAPAKKQSKRNLGSDLDTVGLCPRPYKMVFRTEEEAEAEIDRLDNGRMDVYRCKCGALHIGHPTPMDMARKAKQEYKDWATTAGE